MLQKVHSKPQMKFGTDGMRGRAEEFDISGIRRIGYEIAQQLPNRSTYVIGRDTRQSGVEFEQALRAGIESVGRGIIVENAGVVPTPLLSYMSAKSGEGGVMITASHNPSHDNGFKFFDEKGRKISKHLEGELQKSYDNTSLEVLSKTSMSQLCRRSEFLRHRYIAGIKKLLEESEFQGKIAIDCANGATSEIAREVFQPTKRGLEFELFANTPNGININEECGVTHSQFLERILQTSDYQLGISFDGDGDRVGFVDELGNQISGDFVLAYLARNYKKKEDLTMIQ